MDKPPKVESSHLAIGLTGLLIVNIMTSSFVVMRIEYLRTAMLNLHTQFHWLLSLTTAAFMCIIGLYTFASYVVITRKKINKAVVLGTSIINTILVAVTVLLMADLVMVLGLIPPTILIIVLASNLGI